MGYAQLSAGEEVPLRVFAAMIAGLSPTVCGVTVNRLCGSGLEALLIGSRAIWSGEASLLMVGGAESMSRAPLVLSTAEKAFAGNQMLVDSVIGWRFPHPALLIGSESAANKYGLKPRARMLAGAVTGVSPRVMGLGPVEAIRKVLHRTKLNLDDMDVIEINEAFAAQALGCMKQLQLQENDSRVNPNGGAIALGHPLGASGARLALTAMRQLEATGGRYALISLCIGIGQGVVAIIERV